MIALLIVLRDRLMVVLVSFGSAYMRTWHPELYTDEARYMEWLAEHAQPTADPPGEVVVDWSAQC